MKLIKRLLWMIPLIIKWIFIFALWTIAIVGIIAITVVWLAWEEAGEHV